MSTLWSIFEFTCLVLNIHNDPMPLSTFKTVMVRIYTTVGNNLQPHT